MEHALQPVGHLSAAGFLHKAEHPGENDHDGDDGHRGVVFLPGLDGQDVCEQADPAQDQQDDGKGIEKGGIEALGQGVPAAAGQDVFAINLSGLCGLGRGEAGLGCAIFGQQAGLLLGRGPEKAGLDALCAFALCPGFGQGSFHHFLHDSVPPNMSFARFGKDTVLGRRIVLLCSGAEGERDGKASALPFCDPMISR